jgi:hypothetical protein
MGRWGRRGARCRKNDIVSKRKEEIWIFDIKKKQNKKEYFYPW